MKKPTNAAIPSVQSLASVDITSATFKANPFPFYAQLRAEAPVFAVMLPTKERAWLVTRYDDVLSVLKDERFAKDRHNAMSPEQLKTNICHSVMVCITVSVLPWPALKGKSPSARLSSACQICVSTLHQINYAGVVPSFCAD